MKRLFLIVLLPILFGCEEIIEVDINSTDPQIIIEANLTNSLDKNFVNITESTDFYNPNEYKTISNAEVTIRENDGTSYLLEEIIPGRYIHNSLMSNPQTNYTIEVNYLNQNYSAESFAPNTIEIDSLSYKLESRPFSEEEKFLELHVYFKDKQDQKDYARFVVYKNGKKFDRIFLYNDRLTNGNSIDFFFFNFQDEEFYAGDDIEVELLTIDEQTYTYFNTLRKALARSSGGPFGPTAPTNPTTNWSNNAFGYFSAFTISSSSIVIE
jgi:Domain of unknown function (DUF4249)